MLVFANLRRVAFGLSENLRHLTLEVVVVFDARKAKALKAGEHIIVDEAPGLRLVASNTRMTWTYRYKNDEGRMKQVAMGHWPAMSYAAALGKWDELRQQRGAGQDLAKEKKLVTAKVRSTRSRVVDQYLVANLLDEYLEGHVKRNRKPKGYAETARLLSHLYTAPIRGLPPAAVKRVHAFELLETLGARAPVLANTLRTELGAAWEYALDAGRIPEETPNWWRQILRGKLRSRGQIVNGTHQGRVRRVLDAQEMATLIKFLPNFSQLIDDLLTMYIWTGARGAEIVQMEASEVGQEADGWWWTVPREKLKTGRHDLAVDFRVPLVGRALTVVQRRLALYQKGYLFPSQNANARSPHVEQKIIGVATYWVRPETCNERLPADRLKVLRLKPWAPHDLRRTVKTTLASMGCPEEVSEAVLGHMPPGIVGVYNRHTYDKERRLWLTLLAEHWEGLARG